MTLRRLAPLNQPKLRASAAIESDFEPGNAQRVDAGTGVVIVPVGLVLDLDAFGLDLGFQVSSLRQRQVFKNCPMGVAGNDRGNALVIVVCPFMEGLSTSLHRPGFRAARVGSFTPQRWRSGQK